MESNPSTRISDFLFWILTFLISLLYVKGFFWHDDTRILLQVVEKIYQGHGAGYTQGDRVQVHSSPLWTYFLLLFRMLTSSYSVVIILGSLIPLLGVIIWFRIKYRPFSFFLLIVLFSSNLLFSFWGSGLDNPMTYALLTILFYAFAKDRVRLFILMASLLLVNRIDAIFYVAPLASWFIIKRPFKENLINFIKYAWPFYLHLLFAFVYYGTLFPNSYYSKIASVKISMAEHFIVFARYVFLTVKHSPLDVLFLIAPVLLFYFYKGVLSKEQKTKALLGLTASGCTLFFFFWVGFEHLNPRFLGVLSMLSILITFEFFAPLIQQALSDKKTHTPVLITVVMLCIIGGTSLYLPLNKLRFMDDKDLGRNPEYYQNFRNSYENYMFDLQIICSHLRLFHSRPQPQLQRPEEELHTVGFVGEAGLAMEIGANFNNIDFYGIVDPLMARIKTNQSYYYPGHNTRPIPRGYAETLMEGSNQIVHPDMAAYYDRLKNVVSGNLLSASRFKDIFYLMTHDVPLDPNDPEDAIYFIDREDYDQILSEKYGAYRHLGDEWTIYIKDGEKSEAFKSQYWQAHEMQDSVMLSMDFSERPFYEALSGKHMLTPITNGPNIGLRPGNYLFEIDYENTEATDSIAGRWQAMAFTSVGEQVIELGEGNFKATDSEKGTVTGAFSIEPLQDMAHFSMATFARNSGSLTIKGLRISRVEVLEK